VIVGISVGNSNGAADGFETDVIFQLERERCELSGCLILTVTAYCVGDGGVQTRIYSLCHNMFGIKSVTQNI